MGQEAGEWGRWGVEYMTLRSQVTHEELSAGEHAHDPGAVLPPHAFVGPAALTAARRPGQPESREEKDSTLGPSVLTRNYHSLMG